MKPAYLFFYTLLLSCTLIACEQQPAEKQPNIILILADDMGFGDPGSYNPASKVPTPNIDRIAEEGIRLTDAHSPSAVCTPTRYGVLTGRYAWRTQLKKGVLWGYSPNLIDTARVTVASMLQEKGYQTGGVGKWHLGLGEADTTDYFVDLTPGPVDHGFDYYYGIPASLDMQPYVYFENEQVVETPTEEVAFSAHRRQEGGGFWRAGPVAPSFKHINVLPDITQKAVDFIESEAADPDPFFLYIPLSAPHTPWLPTAPFKDASGAGYYGDFATQVDWSVGEVLKALDRLSITENTLIVFTSDNGAHWYPKDIETFGHQANGHLRGQKADIWEGGHRVPFVVRWPAEIAAGITSDETTTHTDFLATFAELVGFSLPADAGEDSFSMLSVWKGETPETPIRNSTIHHSLDGMFAIRQGSWKLIEGRGSGGFTQPARIDPAAGEPVGQLYNLEDDPSESNNVYLEHPEVVADLLKLLEENRSAGRSRMN
ncbi:MAG: arylsulfatase [Rhodothermales bacterium]